ncbi:MAG: hypothetical protein ACRCZS_07260 [Chroococcidiopsis sp.]
MVGVKHSTRSGRSVASSSITLLHSRRYDRALCKPTISRVAASNANHTHCCCPSQSTNDHNSVMWIVKGSAAISSIITTHPTSCSQ